MSTDRAITQSHRYNLPSRHSAVQAAFLFTATGDRGKHVAFHEHEALELVYYVQGKGRSTVGTDKNRVAPHIFTITPAGVQHDQYNDSKMISICLGIIGSGLEDLQGCWVDHTEEVHAGVVRLLAEVQQQQSGFETVCEGLTLEIIGLVRRAAESKSTRPSKERVVARAIDLIQQHKGRISVASLSRELYLSKDYLRHLFQEYAGDSPMRHIISARIDLAKTLLDRHDLSIAEIATQAGFDNPYYFSRIFKQVTGLAPSHYRSAM